MRTKLRSLVRKIRARLQAPAIEIDRIPPPLGLREWAAHTYLAGEGVEIGALQNPLKLPPQARVRYVDRMSVPNLRQHYPELNDLNLVEVDLIDDGEKLTSLQNNSCDFLIANHFIEHCGDPIGTLKNFFRVVRPGGILYLAVPDKRYTFDRDRPVTPLAHLLEDHQYGPERSRQQHFEEWVRLVNKVEGPSKVEATTKELMEKDYSIHFHVWTQAEFLEFVHAVQRMLAFEIEVFLKHEHEMIMVLRKTAAGNGQSLAA